MAGNRKSRQHQPTTATASLELGDRIIPTNRLHLDLSNYRHGAVESEAKAIAALCSTERIVELAGDIVKRGSLSPLDVLGVVPMLGSPRHFVVVEGNRRACALIVLADPSRAPESYRARIKQIVGAGHSPNEIRVHVFRDKSAAKQWIDLRHLGDQDGIGVRPWNPTQKQRAAAGNHQSSAGDNALAVKVLDRLVGQRLLSEDERSKVAVTTITRYLSSPAVRAIFGLADRKELIYTHDPDEVDAVLRRLVADSMTSLSDGNFRVSSRTNSRERTQYANELKAEGATPSTPLDEPIPPPGPGAIGNRPRSTSKEKTRSAQNPDTRHHLFPSDFTVIVKDPVVLRLRGEGLTLDVENYSFCANFLLRATVERLLSQFAKKRGKWRDKLSDSALTQACADELKSMGVQRDILSVIQKAAGSQDTPYSLHSLGHAVHGGSIPTGRDLKRYFDTWRPVLEAILKALSNK